MSGERDPQKTSTVSRGFLYFLVATAMISGALVMVLEVLGSRVISPFFGVSLFIWTSLITVTLVSLAIGYAAGGVLSDRKDTPDYLYGIIFAAGVLVLIIPALKGPVLRACQPMGLRAGAFSSAALIFGPPLCLLGCVSPYIIRIAARELKNIGRTVGVFYALSTVGSFVGTVLTGFVLIVYSNVNAIFGFIGSALVLLSAAYFLLFRKTWYGVALLLAAPLLLLRPESPQSKVMANGTTATLVHNRDSFYGSLKVVDYSFGDRRTRELTIDGLVQGGMDMNSGLSIYEYAYFMEFLPYSINPEGRRCLAIGLGAGLVPMWYERMGIATDVVDIDPHVVDIAQKYFGFSPRGRVFVEDARYFLMTSPDRYDYVVLDVFTGDTTPSHLLSREAVALVHERMSARGILAINLIGGLRKNNFITASVVKTLKAEFRQVLIIPLFNPAEGEGEGNMAIIAYDADMVMDPEKWRSLAVHPLAQPNVERFMGREFAFPPQTPAIILSDDYNPVDFFDLRVKENVRKNILKDTDWDILI